MQSDNRFGRRAGLDAPRSGPSGDPRERPAGWDAQSDAAFNDIDGVEGRRAGARVLDAVAPIAQSVTATEAAAST